MSTVAVPRLAAPGRLARISDLILPIGMVAGVLAIVMPLPAELMDLLLPSKITIAVIILLTTLYVKTPLEFNIFPSLLLATTLFRLVLNVATTRLILTRAGSEGLWAAGGVVKSFGEFVTGGGLGTGKIVVGLVIFSIIVLIQFVVITKGATRISEVAARFTLDGMPGKQMAIDADLAAGAIDDREAQRRRLEVSQQADFFGAMDGAGKFVRGDAIAGIVIILINIIGGLFIGIAENGLGVREAVELYTTLTIGDGLVTQIPAFLISVAAAMLVTRSNQESNLPREFIRQLFSRPQALVVAGLFLGVLVFTSLPRIPLLALGVACVGLAVFLSRRETKVQAVQAKKRLETARQAEQRVEEYLTVDPMELELGVGLIRLADPKRGGDLLERIRRVRQSLAVEIGIVLPKVRVRDNMRLDAHGYRIKISDVAAAEGSISEQQADPTGTVAAHLTETVRLHADELLTRDAVKHLIDELRKNSPAVVDELIPGVMKLGEVQQVLRMLLRESVPIRQLGIILETLGDYAPQAKGLTFLTEHVRRRLARTLCAQYRDEAGRLHVVTLDPEVEEQIRSGIEQDEDGLRIRLAPRAVEEICRSIEHEAEKLVEQGRPPIALVSPDIRPALKHITASHIPQLVVLSYAEITPDTRIEAVTRVLQAA